MMNILDKYPSFIFETENIKTKRLLAQKTRRNDEFTCFYLLRPFSIYFSVIIVKYTNIKANFVSLLMVCISLASPIILYSLSTIGYILFWTPILFYFIYFLDVIDGEIARLKGETSLLGEWLDKFLHYSLPILFLTYIYLITYFCHLSLFVVIFSLINISLEFFIMNTTHVAVGLNKTYSKIKNEFLHELFFFIKFLLSKHNFYLFFPIVYLFIQSDSVNILSLTTIIYLSIFLIVSLYKTIKFYINSFHVKKT